MKKVSASRIHSRWGSVSPLERRAGAGPARSESSASLDGCTSDSWRTPDRPRSGRRRQPGPVARSPASGAWWPGRWRAAPRRRRRGWPPADHQGAAPPSSRRVRGPVGRTNPAGPLSTEAHGLPRRRRWPGRRSGAAPGTPALPLEAPGELDPPVRAARSRTPARSWTASSPNETAPSKEPAGGRARVRRRCPPAPLGVRSPAGCRRIFEEEPARVGPFAVRDDPP
jgi:hypothetical protein